MPKLTIDIIVEGMNRLDAVWDGIDPPLYSITTRESGVLEVETILKGEKTTKKFTAGTIFVGRSSECAIQIPPELRHSRAVSRKQGAFSYGDCWCYEPLAKDNPTYFNDQPLPPGAVARISKDALLSIGPMQREPIKYAITLKLGVQ